MNNFAHRPNPLKQTVFLYSYIQAGSSYLNAGNAGINSLILV
ncbi:hypothetical protein GLIP_4337 [Aliiglaciecola lipolytica E3]|uniref:Uncharacterized protein n=1 Tax=Aliiglaciecola lipolytica E3 TaxID=1127673 RepID=K6YK11_9ALTE|nr:hypothetical protein GLIP_4337 [Aliiglaciecola lipolytica E3]